MAGETSTSTETSTDTTDANETTVAPDVLLAESQGIEMVSDEDLMGFDTDPEKTAADKVIADEAAATEKAAADKVIADKAITDKAAADKVIADAKDAAVKGDKSKDVKTGDSSTSSDETHPKGYVPLEAVKEVRETNKYLKDQIALLQQQIDAKVAPKVEPEKAPEPPTFDVLSDEDFKSLAEDEPTKALLYVTKLNAHNVELAKFEAAQTTAATEKANAAKQESQTAEEVNTIIATTETTMEELVPGIFTEGEVGDVARKEISDFAETLGFDEDMFYLTNPMTQIILPGEDQPLMLGEQAASILSVLVKAKTSIKEAATAVDETALEAKIRKEVEAELVAKFKKDGMEGFRSLTDVTKVDGEKNLGDVPAILTDEQYNLLSEKEQEAYLTGPG